MTNHALRKRLDKIENARVSGYAIATQLAGETQEQAISRHLETHPEDRGKHIIVLDEIDMAL